MSPTRPAAPRSSFGPSPRRPGKWQVSTGGGLSPVWRADGKELFYLGPDRALVAVPITVTAGRPEPGTARSLFQNAGLRPATMWGANPYEVTADGRFLANVVIGEADASPIVLQTGAQR